jgi:hypothetical protein
MITNLSIGIGKAICATNEDKQLRLYKTLHFTYAGSWLILEIHAMLASLEKAT